MELVICSGIVSLIANLRSLCSSEEIFDQLSLCELLLNDLSASCSELAAYSLGSQNTGKVPPVRGVAASVMQPYVKVMD
jgi:hypothetical protein